MAAKVASRPRVQLDCPEKARFLYRPAPYKVMYGGRGGSKSWDFADALLVLGTQKKLFIVCAREIQKSIKESVHKLLSDQIDRLKLGAFYDVKDAEIEGLNGTRFVFVGIRSHTAAIKSMEGIDIFAVFEATFVSQSSWEIVLPTIRGDPPFGPFGLGSEIWIEFNPELASDYTYRYWVSDPPEGTVAVEINWRDNPWFPETLRRQKDELRKRDHDAYLTVWEGKTRVALQGAIYAKEYAAALKEGRIAPNVKPDRGRGVIVAFDLGNADMCAMWFMQQVGMEHHAIDYYGNVGFGMDHYLEQIQARKYNIASIWLPHDASNKHQVATKRGVTTTIESQVRDVYPGDNKVRIIPRTTNKALAINAVRILFPRLYVHETNCADGLLALQHYQYEVDPDRKDPLGNPQRSKNPLHNWASNPADALATYAQGLREGHKALPAANDEEDAAWNVRQHPQSWMRN